jgi:hypothetical protein
MFKTESTICGAAGAAETARPIDLEKVFFRVTLQTIKGRCQGSETLDNPQVLQRLGVILQDGINAEVAQFLSPF